MKKLIPFLVLGAGAVMLASGSKRDRPKRELSESEESPQIQVLVFEASWCAACQVAKPALLEVSKKHPDIPFRFVDFDAEGELARQFEVNALPTIIALVNGEEVRRVEGAGTVERYDEVIAEARDMVSGAIPLPEKSEDLKKLPPGD